MFKPVRLSRFLAKQKLLGTGVRKGETLEYALDEYTRLLVYDIFNPDTKILLKLCSSSPVLKISDYFTELDIDADKYNVSFQSAKPHLYKLCLDTYNIARKETKVSLRDVKIPKELKISTVLADKIDFGEDIDLVYQLNNGMCISGVEDIEKDIRFNREISSKKLADLGSTIDAVNFSTKHLGVTEITVECLLNLKSGHFNKLETLDLSSIDKIDMSGNNSKPMHIWRNKLKEVKVSKELAYIMIQILLHTIIVQDKYSTVQDRPVIWVDSELITNKLGVKQLAFGVKNKNTDLFGEIDVYTLDREIDTSIFNSGTFSSVIQSIYEIEELSEKVYKKLIVDGRVKLEETEMILVD